MREFLILVAALGLAPEPETNGQGQEQPLARAEITEYLPNGGVHPSRTTIMMINREFLPLAERMAAAIRKNFAWFKVYATAHPDGPLPYHPNLGLSKKEYRHMLALLAQQKLGEIEQGQLSVFNLPDGGLALAAAGHAAHLNGIVIYPDRDYVDTPWGRLTKRTLIDQSDPQSPTGPWKGVQWRSEEISPKVKLALGRRRSGEKVIYFDVMPSEDQTLFLIYEDR